MKDITTIFCIFILSVSLVFTNVYKAKANSDLQCHIINGMIEDNKEFSLRNAAFEFYAYLAAKNGVTYIDANEVTRIAQRVHSFCMANPLNYVNEELDRIGFNPISNDLPLFPTCDAFLWLMDNDEPTWRMVQNWVDEYGQTLTNAQDSFLPDDMYCRRNPSHTVLDSIAEQLEYYGY